MGAIYRLEMDRLHISGEMKEVIDIAFDLCISDLLDATSDTLTIDMNTVQYISSIYVGRLVAACKRAEKRGKRILIIAPEAIRAVLELAGLNQLAEIRSHEKFPPIRKYGAER